MASAIAMTNGYDPSAYYHDYRKYQVFATVKEMNETERLRLFAEGDKVTKGAKEFYSWLIRYSCRVIGVSWQLVENMAERYGKSDRTIKRYISELKKAGWIEVIRLTEGNLKGQNIYRIVKAYPVKAVETRKEEETNGSGSLNFDPTDVPSKMSPRDGAEEANSGEGFGGGNPEGNHSFKSSLKSLNHLSKDRKDDAKNDPSDESKKGKQGKDEAPQDGGYYDEIPSLVRIRLVAKNRSAKFVNGCFKRITWAFRATELSRFTSIDELAFEIANKIQYVYNMERKGRISDNFFGYFYKAMLDLFKKIEARYLDEEYEELMGEVADSEGYDFRKSPLYQAYQASEYEREDSADESDVPSLAELVDMYGYDRELLTYRVSQWYGVTAGQADIMIADYLGEDLSGLGLPI